MKLNSTVALTLILLAMMLGAGFVSSMWGFTLGHEALKGVTQPDVRPIKDIADKQKAAPGKEGLTILREEDILTKVNEYVKIAARTRNLRTRTTRKRRTRTSKLTITAPLLQIANRRLSQRSHRHPLPVPILISTYRSKVRIGGSC
jgi:hypothetical protein